MAYTKVNWEAYTGPGTGTLLTPARFNQMETQYDEVVSYWGTTGSFMVQTTAEIRVEVSSSEPSPAAGRIYFNSSTDELKLYVSDGSTWEAINELS